MNQKLPGTEVSPTGREYLYVELPPKKPPGKHFRDVTDFGDVEPPTSGGALEELVIIHLPDGRQMLGLSYKGDVAGWRRIILAACDSMALDSGTIIGPFLRLSAGSEIALDDCRIEFFPTTAKRR